MNSEDYQGHGKVVAKRIEEEFRLGVELLGTEESDVIGSVEETKDGDQVEQAEESDGRIDQTEPCGEQGKCSVGRSE